MSPNWLSWRPIAMVLAERIYDIPLPWQKMRSRQGQESAKVVRAVMKLGRNRNDVVIYVPNVSLPWHVCTCDHDPRWQLQQASKRMRCESTRSVLAGGRIYGSAKCHYEKTQRRFTCVAWLHAGTRQRGGLEHGQLGDEQPHSDNQPRKKTVTRTDGCHRCAGPAPTPWWFLSGLPALLVFFMIRRASLGERRHAANSLELDARNASAPRCVTTAK